jgi:hypothetical protein
MHAPAPANAFRRKLAAAHMDARAPHGGRVKSLPSAATIPLLATRVYPEIGNETPKTAARAQLTTDLKPMSSAVRRSPRAGSQRISPVRARLSVMHDSSFCARFCARPI